MKRIKAACLLQTIHFQLKDDIGHAAAVKAVKDELENYKVQLERKHTKFQIVDEEEQSDGSVIVHIKKQYNNHNFDEYMK